MGRNPTIVGFSYSPRDARQRVGVSAKRYGLPHRVLIIVRFEKGYERRRHGTLAGFIELVRWPKFVNGSAQIVAEHLLQRIFHATLRLSSPSHEHRRSRGLGSLDTFRM